jgi:hypothetical protein
MNTSPVIFNVPWLDAENNRGYGPLPIPSDRDRQVSELIGQWLSLDENRRMEATRSISARELDTLLAYSERMASRAVRERSREWIFLGLVALGLDGWRTDWRENVIVLALHYDACQRIGESAEGMFKEAGGVLPLNVSRALTSFLKRKPENQSLEAMRFIASADAEGFRYRSIW